MLETIFSGGFDTATTAAAIGGAEFLICLGAAILIGLIISAAYTFHSTYTSSFLITLALLPSIISIVIMMVNGNIGAGVAVAGAFSLVRFRSLPGTAREIGAIFLAMAAGLTVGMGYIGIAFLFVVIICLANIILSAAGYGSRRKPENRKTLRITIPEDLDYAEVFDDLFLKYTDNYSLQAVKTTNMGSLFKLTYNVSLKDQAQEKSFIDELRCRNGNLEISSSIQEMVKGEL